MIDVIVGGIIAIIASIIAAIWIENLRRPKLTLEIETPPSDNPQMNMRNLRVKLCNEPLSGWAKWMVRSPALQCRAEITFHHRDGHNVFGRVMEGRWASSPEPIASGIFDLKGEIKFNLLDLTTITQASRVDLYPGDSELLDIANRPYDDANCYGWNNEAYFSSPRWRNPDWTLVPERYLVKVVIRSSGQNCIGHFRLINDVSRTDFRLEPASRGERDRLARGAGEALPWLPDDAW